MFTDLPESLQHRWNYILKSDVGLVTEKVSEQQQATSVQHVLDAQDYAVQLAFESTMNTMKFKLGIIGGLNSSETMCLSRALVPEAKDKAIDLFLMHIGEIFLKNQVSKN